MKKLGALVATQTARDVQCVKTRKLKLKRIYRVAVERTNVSIRETLSLEELHGTRNLSLCTLSGRGSSLV